MCVGDDGSRVLTDAEEHIADADVDEQEHSGRIISDTYSWH
jgi:hypothetical protein